MSDRHGSTPNPFRRNTFSCFGIYLESEEDHTSIPGFQKNQLTPKWEAGFGGLVGVSLSVGLQTLGTTVRTWRKSQSTPIFSVSLSRCRRFGIPWKELHIASMSHAQSHRLTCAQPLDRNSSPCQKPQANQMIGTYRWTSLSGSSLHIALGGRRTSGWWEKQNIVCSMRG